MNGLINSYTKFINEVYLSLCIRSSLTGEEIDALLDSVDAYEYYCLNTTSDHEASSVEYSKYLMDCYSLYC